MSPKLLEKNFSIFSKNNKIIISFKENYLIANIEFTPKLSVLKNDVTTFRLQATQ